METKRKRYQLKRKSETEEERLQNERKKRKIVNENESVNKLISVFHKLVAEGPTHICICRDQLWYRHSVEQATVLLKVKNCATRKCIKNVSNNHLRSKWVCKTCLTNLKGNKIPRCATANKMQFPMKPKFLDLTEEECRLVSPRLVFQKLHEAPRGKQKTICGNIVNVPADVINTVAALPRSCEQAGTRKVQLKRKLKSKSYTLSQNIRPAKVFMAAEWLTKHRHA